MRYIFNACLLADCGTCATSSTLVCLQIAEHALHLQRFSAHVCVDRFSEEIQVCDQRLVSYSAHYKRIDSISDNVKEFQAMRKLRVFPLDSWGVPENTTLTKAMYIRSLITLRLTIHILRHHRPCSP